MRNRIPLVLVALLLVAALGVSSQRAVSSTYVHVVDNDSPRFRASSDWGTSSYSPDRFRSDYRFTTPGSGAGQASFRVRIPETGSYRVQARWPANSGYNGSARFLIHTASGWKVVTVNQRRDGGRWMTLGRFRMTAGDGWKVRVAPNSRTKGYIIADAVRVVRVTGSTSGGNEQPASSQVTGADILQEARSWLGVPYRYGGSDRGGVDCSGLTLKVYEKFGIQLPRTARDQYHSGPGTKVARNELRRGYLVFGYADGYGSGIQHVGIVTGDGRMIHAPAPGTVVRYDDLPNGWYNVLGVKRIVPPA
jgi:cell wall-associated NlpC family hydrolase